MIGDIPSGVLARVYTCLRSLRRQWPLQQATDAMPVLPGSEADLTSSSQSPHAKMCFAHWGEDMILAYVFDKMPAGRYLDIGCYHPERASNTHLLFRNGWSGVNVDPNPFMIAAFNDQRPQDVNLNIAVGKTRAEMTYYMFDEWATSNTLSSAFAQHISDNQKRPIEQRFVVPVITLRELMEKYFFSGAPEFLNVDVEDLDLDVLESNDWQRFRPNIVAVEDISCSMREPSASKICGFMKDNDYVFFSRTIYTSFFIERLFNDATQQFR